ncbi:MAG: class II glutamine amidotransferase domain-containing protein [Acidimicrobiales bacterium]
MCGIVGLHCKTDRFRSCLGELIVPMLDALTPRGPDSAGIAIYNHVGEDAWKYSLRAPEKSYDWEPFGAKLAGLVHGEVVLVPRGDDAVAIIKAVPEIVLPAVGELADSMAVVGFGQAIEVFKDVGAAGEVCARYGVADMAGYQAVGHTRMATESAVTTAHSHPFSVSSDLALVHNGSFSNHATIRRELVTEGIFCETDNDSEVAARFLGAELGGGADLDKALRRVLETFDGFFTLLVTSESSFAVVRDSFACKPLVVAETDDYVAVGSEYVALADLPGVEDAKVFEPMPEEVFTWSTPSR